MNPHSIGGDRDDKCLLVNANMSSGDHAVKQNHAG